MRVFVGLDLPQDVRDRLAVQQYLIKPPRALDPAGFHLTLVFLDEVDLPALDRLHEELERIHHPGFDLALRGFELTGTASASAIWAGVVPSAPLAGLQAKVARAARVAGLHPEARKFRPHVSIARFARLAGAQSARVERAVIEVAGFRTEPFGVGAFCLFRSHLHRDGADYEVLAQYDLDAGQKVS